MGVFRLKLFKPQTSAVDSARLSPSGMVLNVSTFGVMPTQNSAKSDAAMENPAHFESAC